MIDAFTIASGQPWLLTSEALETVLTVAQRLGDPQALQTRVGQALDNTRSVVMRNGVAVIPVVGPIFRRANMFTEISGATSTGMLARDIQTAIDNPYVRGIVLDIDSPGGEAAGINELAKLIASARDKKRIVAYASGSMASGAYWLGSAAAEIVVDDIAMLGSIGAVMSYSDTSERDAKSGVRQIDIVSSQSPDKRVDITTDDGREKVRAVLDALADRFVSAVAENRGETTDKVLSDFGRGGVLVGADAVKAGMADRIGSLEAVIAELAGSASTSQRKTPMSTSNKGRVTVSSTEDLQTALAAGYEPEQIAIASATDQQLAAARAEGMAEGKAAAAADAVTAERTRIRALQDIAQPGFEDELNAAIDAGTTAEAFAMTMLTTARDRGITLGAMRGDAPKAAAHTQPANGSQHSGGQKVVQESVFERRRKQAEAARGK